MRHQLCEITLATKAVYERYCGIDYHGSHFYGTVETTGNLTRIPLETFRESTENRVGKY